MFKSSAGIVKLLVAASTLITGGSRLLAQGAAISYEGRLTDDGRPADGVYDFHFTLHDTVAAGVPLGGAVVRAEDIPVRAGRFEVTLNFGGDAFTGGSRWIEISVRTNDPAASFTTLSPRQPLLPTPYAIHARSAGTVDAGNLTGTLAEARLPANAARLDANQVFCGENTFSSPDNFFRGTFAGNGAALTGLQGIHLVPGTVGTEQLVDEAVVAGKLSASVRNSTFWNLTGNAGTTPGTHFVGTTDGQPLELRVEGRRGLRLEPGGGTVNVIGGSSENGVGAGVSGVTIGGGSANRVLAHSGTVGGGSANTNGAIGATIGGGQINGIGLNAFQATVSGGWQNLVGAGSVQATVGGGRQDVVEANAAAATVSGGHGNTIRFGATDSAIGGGWQNVHETNATGAVIGGGRRNLVDMDTYGGTIGGGGESNRVRANLASIGGGLFNEIRANSYLATIGGGYFNTVEAEATGATVVGGSGNTIRASAGSALIGGGAENTIETGSWGTVVRGWPREFSEAAKRRRRSGGRHVE